jgi:hypothetical protein
MDTRGCNLYQRELGETVTQKVTPRVFIIPGSTHPWHSPACPRRTAALRPQVLLQPADAVRR